MFLLVYNCFKDIKRFARKSVVNPIKLPAHKLELPLLTFG